MSVSTLMSSCLQWESWKSVYVGHYIWMQRNRPILMKLQNLLVLKRLSQFEVRHVMVPSTISVKSWMSMKVHLLMLTGSCKGINWATHTFLSHPALWCWESRISLDQVTHTGWDTRRLILILWFPVFILL